MATDPGLSTFAHLLSEDLTKTIYSFVLDLDELLA